MFSTSIHGQCRLSIGCRINSIGHGSSLGLLWVPQQQEERAMRIIETPEKTVSITLHLPSTSTFSR